MIKVEVIENFSLKDFNKLEDLQRATSKNQDGQLYMGDTFNCTKEMVDYLTGNNAIKKAVVKVIEVESEKEELEFIPIEKIEETIGGELAIEEVKPKIVVKPKKKKHSKK